MLWAKVRGLFKGRRKILIACIIIAVIGLSIFAYLYLVERERARLVEGEFIKLPPPRLKGTMSLEEAIHGRRSERSFVDRPLTLDQLSQLLWAAQGITDEARGFRAAPSAGAQYPLDIYIVIGEGCVEDLEPGVYRYYPHEHSILFYAEGDIRSTLAKACLGQSFIANAPVAIVITAEYDRITDRYGDRGVRYTYMEVGHVGQNIYLQAEALGLGTVAVGAFDDSEVAEVLRLPQEHEPLYVMPVGYTT